MLSTSAEHFCAVRLSDQSEHITQELSYWPVMLFELKMSEHITHMHTDNCHDGSSIWREFVKSEVRPLIVH